MTKYQELWFWIEAVLASGLVMFLHRVLYWGFIPTVIAAALFGALFAFIMWRSFMKGI